MGIVPLCPDGDYDLRCKLPVGHATGHLYGPVDAQGRFVDTPGDADGVEAQVP